MSRVILIGAIIIILGALGLWYVYPDLSGETALQAGTAATSTSTAGGQNTTGGTSASGGTSTFRSIFSQSGSYECVYEQVDSSSRTSSVVRIADGKMRGEFRTMTGTDSIGSLMIYSGGTLYSWKEGATTGKRSTIRTIADLPEAIPADLTSGAVYGGSLDNVGWDCHPWSKDTTQFTIPAYVTFTAA